jgi:hypothetical protein
MHPAVKISEEADTSSEDLVVSLLLLAKVQLIEEEIVFELDDSPED